MKTNAPPATGQRLPWASLPAPVLATIEAGLVTRIVAAQDQPGGFSPGVAARIRTADGRALFCKAVGPELNPSSPELHRREAQIAARLPAGIPVPRLHLSGTDEQTGWVWLVFDQISGRQPAVPWRGDELDRVTTMLNELHLALTPSPVSLDLAEPVGESPLFQANWWGKVVAEQPAGFDDWSLRNAHRLAALEAGVVEASRGDTLLHLDIRADNVLLTERDAYLVDWPHARTGAPWVDYMCFIPSAVMQGGPPPEDLLNRAPSAAGADPQAIDAVLAVITGFLLYGACQPPPPGLPTLRPFQRAQGEVARDWLRRRTGWE